jgi:hypothetical protein
MKVLSEENMEEGEGREEDVQEDNVKSFELN